MNRSQAQTDAGSLRLTVDLLPGDGRVLMLTEREIAAVTIDAPAQARLGDKLPLTFAVVDGDGEALPAVVPLHVSILDPQGREAEFSGYYGAKTDVCRSSLTSQRTTSQAPGRSEHGNSPRAASRSSR